MWLHQPQPNSGLDTLELCKRLFLQSLCEICGFEEGSHVLSGVPGWGGKSAPLPEREEREPLPTDPLQGASL